MNQRQTVEARNRILEDAVDSIRALYQDGTVSPRREDYKLYLALSLLSTSLKEGNFEYTLANLNNLVDRKMPRPSDDVVMDDGVYAY